MRTCAALLQIDDRDRLAEDLGGVEPVGIGAHGDTADEAVLGRHRLGPAKRVRAAGCVIARQRPGTARGFVFLSLEDETGIANAIITPNLFEQNRLLLVGEQFLLVEGVLQNLDNVVSVKAERVLPLAITGAATSSHDFR
jgi:error-prone DNA polymerase